MRYEQASDRDDRERVKQDLLVNYWALHDPAERDRLLLQPSVGVDPMPRAEHQTGSQWVSPSVRLRH